MDLRISRLCSKFNFQVPNMTPLTPPSWEFSSRTRLKNCPIFRIFQTCAFFGSYTKDEMFRLFMVITSHISAYCIEALGSNDLTWAVCPHTKRESPQGRLERARVSSEFARRSPKVKVCPFTDPCKPPVPFYFNMPA
jgi:hypothetical protein